MSLARVPNGQCAQRSTGGDATGAAYSITLSNQSCLATYLFVYQNAPDSWATDAKMLAWMSAFVNPGVSRTFTWHPIFGMSWADTGSLGPEANYQACETLEASQANMVMLDYDQAYCFTDARSGGDPGFLYLQCNADIPWSSSASVGTTISGLPIYAVQAQPGLCITSYPYPAYCLGHGNFTQGAVIDPDQIACPQPFAFPAGVYALQATLQSDNTWTTPTCTES
jgi:hypothetical protein